jgi:hypothetical protein
LAFNSPKTSDGRTIMAMFGKAEIRFRDTQELPAKCSHHAGKRI